MMADLSYVQKIVEGLCNIPHRAATKEGERQAAEFAKQEMDALGFETHTETFKSIYRLGEPVAIHSTLILVGLLAGFICPITGAIIVGFALFFSAHMFNQKSRIWMRFTPTAQSINAIGHWDAPEPKQTVVLSGHIDAGQTGLMFHPTVKQIFAKLSQKEGSAEGPMYAPFIICATGLFMLIIKAFGGAGLLLNIWHYGVLGFAVLQLAVNLQWLFSPHVPGAIDNATGVAAMLQCAKTLMQDPPKHTNIRLAAVGSEECGMLGMAKYIESHQNEIQSTPTYFINFESVGGGKLHVVGDEGELCRFYYPPAFIGRGLEAAKKAGLGEVPVVSLLAGTDHAVTAIKGYPSFCMIALDDLGVPPNYHEVADKPEGVDYECTCQSADVAVAICRDLDKE